MHKATGYDNISLFLRTSSEILVPILSVCFSYAFELGFFRKFLNSLKVIPIFKTGDKYLVQNYRPISLLSTLPVSKILENYSFDEKLW